MTLTTAYAISSRANRDGWCNPSTRTIKKDIRSGSKATVQRAIAELVELGELRLGSIQIFARGLQLRVDHSQILCGLSIQPIEPLDVYPGPRIRDQPGCLRVRVADHELNDPFWANRAHIEPRGQLPHGLILRC